MDKETGLQKILDCLQKDKVEREAQGKRAAAAEAAAQGLEK